MFRRENAGEQYSENLANPDLEVINIGALPVVSNLGIVQIDKKTPININNFITDLFPKLRAEEFIRLMPAPDILDSIALLVDNNEQDTLKLGNYIISLIQTLKRRNPTFLELVYITSISGLVILFDEHNMTDEEAVIFYCPKNRIVLKKTDN